MIERCRLPAASGVDMARMILKALHGSLRCASVIVTLLVQFTLLVVLIALTVLGGYVMLDATTRMGPTLAETPTSIIGMFGTSLAGLAVCVALMGGWVHWVFPEVDDE